MGQNLLQDVLYVFRALDVVVVEDLLSNLLAWGSWWSFLHFAILLPSLSLFTPVWGIK